MLNTLVQLLLPLVLVNHDKAYHFNVSLPDNAESEIEECIHRSHKTPIIHWQAVLACGHEYFTKLKPNNLTEEDRTVFKRASDNRFGHHPPITGISRRREVRTLSKGEWQNVTDVFRKLFDGGTLQSFGRLHGLALKHAHKGGAFLPWHRVFLTHFEQEMRSINPTVSLPYWDYTIDYDIPKPFNSVLWTPCFFGEDKGVVKSGPFSFLYGAHGAIISRLLAKNVYSTRLINKEDIGRLKGFCDLKDITTGANKTVRDHNIEDLHDSVHAYIGGDMGVENSAYDPIFWFHHAFIDYIWESFREHQMEDCGNVDIECNYRPLNDLGWKDVIKQGPEDTLFGYRHLKNIDGLWRNWTEGFYTYDRQPSCGSTCSGKYLYCDDAQRCLTRTKDACTEKTEERDFRTDENPLLPKLPYAAGTETIGLKGDGRTRDTSEAECEKILEQNRNAKDVKHSVVSSSDLWKNVGLVVLGITLMLPSVFGTYCYLKRKQSVLKKNQS